jgi:hypothetical protein
MQSKTGKLIELTWSDAARQAAIAARQAAAKGKVENPDDLERQASTHEESAKFYNGLVSSARSRGDAGDVAKHLASSDQHLQQAGQLRNRAEDIRSAQKQNDLHESMKSIAGKKLGFGDKLKAIAKGVGRVAKTVGKGALHVAAAYADPTGVMGINKYGPAHPDYWK